MFERDVLFSAPITSFDGWVFDAKVAKVFPDMIRRSVPGYSNVVSMIGILAKYLVQPNTQVYDLGCSIGAVTLAVYRSVRQEKYRIIAIDSSSAMIERCKYYILNYKPSITIEVIHGDILDIDIQNSSLVILNFTLQFLPIKDRQVLLNKIYQGLNPGGALVLSEKFNFEDKSINKLLSNVHHDFKRANGYSELEINQKCSILKNMMLTESIEMHKSRLYRAGFQHSELWFQCLNFGSLIAIKASKT